MNLKKVIVATLVLVAMAAPALANTDDLSRAHAL